MGGKSTCFNHEIIKMHSTFAFSTFYTTHFFRQIVSLKKSRRQFIFLFTPAWELGNLGAWELRNLEILEPWNLGTFLAPCQAISRSFSFSSSLFLFFFFFIAVHSNIFNFFYNLLVLIFLSSSFSFLILRTW